MPFAGATSTQANDINVKGSIVGTWIDADGVPPTAFWRREQSLPVSTIRVRSVLRPGALTQPARWLATGLTVLSIRMVAWHNPATKENLSRCCVHVALCPVACRSAPTFACEREGSHKRKGGPSNLPFERNGCKSLLRRNGLHTRVEAGFVTAGGGLVKNAFLDARIDRRGDRGERRLGGLVVAGGNGVS